MAITQPYSGTLTVSTTELSLISGTSTLQASTTAGIYEVMLDLTALAAADGFRLRIKEKAISGGTQEVLRDITIAGPVADPLYVEASLLLMNGWDVTLMKTGGVDRAIPYSIRMVA